MSLEWMLIRGSGFVAFGFLALATIWGLVLSLGVLPRSVKRLTMAHESLAVGSLVATVVHMGALSADEFIAFDAVDILVPGAAHWEPIAVAWGGFALYGLVIVIASFYLRSHIGQRSWRLLHFLTFGIFLSALVHGLSAGTDTGHPAVMAMYVAVTALVVGLTVVRVAMVASPASPARATVGRSRPRPPGSDRDPTAAPGGEG
jgi:sulfoxide reductase heme-binding subunit YedZ